MDKIFPIKTETACRLKWGWSTIYLSTGETASCHRCRKHEFDLDTFDFHNTEEKVKSREMMLEGKWPGLGCEYCKDIEQAGGESDRTTNLAMPGVPTPPELKDNPIATSVTPTVLEVYFSNLCNQKCLYCTEIFSSMWAEENHKFSKSKTTKDWSVSKNGVIFKNIDNFEDTKQKVYDWLKGKGRNLSQFNFLGGESLFQKEFIECLDVFDQHPNPKLKLQIFTNLNVKKDRLVSIINKIEHLIAKRKIGSFQITASLDNWGPEAEYVRYPLDLREWEENFLYVLSKKYINLIINSTLTPLTIKTYPALLEKVKEWSKIRKVYLYQNSVNWPNNQKIDIFGNIFEEDFQKALALKPVNTQEDQLSRDYLDGIRQQSNSKEPNVKEITSLFHFLNDIDFRRNISWRKTFPWLIEEFGKYDLR